MRILRSLLLLSLLAAPAIFAPHANAQVAIGIGVGPVVAGYDDGYGYGPPACAYGYYPYYPYACSPYGYYGPSWFAGGIFIGAGPWYHGYYGRGPWGGWGHGYYGRGGYGYGRGGYGYGHGVGTPYRGGYGYNGGRSVYAGGYRGGYNSGGYNGGRPARQRLYRRWSPELRWKRRRISRPDRRSVASTAGSFGGGRRGLPWWRLRRWWRIPRRWRRPWRWRSSVSWFAIQA